MKDMNTDLKVKGVFLKGEKKDRMKEKERKENKTKEKKARKRKKEKFTHTVN